MTGHPLSGAAALTAGRPAAPGLRANAAQFGLLVVISAFVGAVVGLERSILPLLARQAFGLEVGMGALSFLATFGLTKAATNLWAGRRTDAWGRKPVLVAGWVAALPIPLMLAWAPHWSWVIAANLLLGLNQGLCWSTAVIMKVDLAGHRRRGLAVGLNESSGYLGLSLAAFGTGYLAQRLGLQLAPLLPGLILVLAGLLLSLFAVRETRHLAAEPGPASVASPPISSVTPPVSPELGPASVASPSISPGTPLVRAEPSPILAAGAPFGAGTPAASMGTAGVSASTPTRAASRTVPVASAVGLVNNLNDAVAWGLFPLLFAGGGLALAEVAFLTAVYPGVWAVSQLGAGALSDRVGRRPLVSTGMVLQASGLAWLTGGHDLATWLPPLVLLGLGTALVYPTLLAAVADAADAPGRGRAIGAYRFWRDLGYFVGALGAGWAVGPLGIEGTIHATALLTFLAGLVAWRGLSS